MLPLHGAKVALPDASTKGIDGEQYAEHGRAASGLCPLAARRLAQALGGQIINDAAT